MPTPFDPSVWPGFLFGLHDRGGEALLLQTSKPGWVVVTAKVTPPADSHNDFSALASAGLGVIVRLNHGYGAAGTIPPATDYAAFAQSCANFVAQSQGARVWIVGNETNMAAERPGNTNGAGGEAITPQLYAQCFAQCRTAIKALPGHAEDWVVPAPPAPWNVETAYPGNPAGDWVQYFQDLLTECVKLHAAPDALALHTYTHGFDAQLVTSDATMDPPFTHRRYHFRAYQDFLAAVPDALRTVPVFITETQAQPWQDADVGWIQAAYREVAAWNAHPAHQPVQALCLFRWETSGDPAWSISDRPALQNDFLAALHQDYRVRWPVGVPGGGGVPAGEGDPAAAAVAAAQNLPHLPINPDAALYKFAQQQGLGAPQTAEFPFTLAGTPFVGQVFQHGIVYAKVGDWGNVMWTGKDG